MAVVNDNKNNDQSFLKGTAKDIATQKGAKKGYKVLKKMIKKIFKISSIIAGSIGGLLMPVIIVMLITVMIVDSIANILDFSQYEQECPELVRAYLNSNYTEFESKVRELCSDTKFMSFVASSEFDNAYTKLVYGGTSSYTQSELKGNYEGVQGNSASWVKKNGTKYEATSVLETVQNYIDSGLDEKNITIRDEYLQGYGDASGYGNKETLKFDKWINYSYYTIPFYYHWNMARQSEYTYPLTCLGLSYNGGSEVGLPNWLEDKNGNWNFMTQASIDGKGWRGVDNYVFSKTSGSPFYTTKTYTDYLNTGWMALTPKNNKNQKNKTYGDVQWEDYKDGKTAAYAEGVMLGYKMANVDNWFEAASNSLWNKDTNYNYHPFSKYFYIGGNGVSKYSKVVDDLYVYDWYDLKTGKKSNYEKYLANPTDIKTLGNREKNGKSIVNTEIENWKNNFAEYFAKEIYYVYPNRDYIVDFFMSSKADKDEKIAFLQRSFYAMATGASLETTIEEEYPVSNGEIGSVYINGTVGSLEIKNITVSNIKTLAYKNDYISAESVSENEMLNTYNEWLALKDKVVTNNGYKPYFSTYYSATVTIKFEDGSEEYIENVPVTYTLTAEEDGTVSSELIFNEKGFSHNRKGQKVTTIKTKFFQKLANSYLKWNDSYYEEQYEYEADSTKRLNENPLDDLKIKCNGFSDEVIDIGNVELNAESIKTGINSTIRKSKVNPLLKMFDGTIKGEREIDFKYSDHSFLTYEVTEKKDDSGKLTGVNIEIFTYYPDLSEYDEGTYRVAYGFETSGAISEAFKLLRYVKENNTLDGVSEVVDFSQLIISDDDGYAKNGFIFNGDNNDLKTFISNLIMKVETSGNWGAARNASYGSEVTITVGVYQEYGERGHKLLRNICKDNKSESKSILGDELYKECLSTNNWVNEKKSFTSEEIANISKLLTTDFGRQMQVTQFKEELEAYLKTAENYGITDWKCQAYFCVMHHQNPVNAKAVANNWVSSYGGKEKANKATDNLSKIHNLCMANPVFGDYGSRYRATYEECSSITFMTTAGAGKNATNVIKYATSEKVLGKPYAWTRVNSSSRYLPSYDCSQLVWCAWNYGGGVNFGVSSPPTAASECQWCSTNAMLVCKGTIKTDALQAGDILFFDNYDGADSRYENIGHTSLYVGNGQLVEAGSGSGKVVLRNISSWDNDNFHSAYRIKKGK